MTRAAAGLLLFAVALSLSGCDVEPFCIDCADGPDSGARDAGPADSGGGGRDTGTLDAGPVDGGPDGCVPGAAERCNGIDDNCDGTIDEGIDLTTDVNNCGACGMSCAPPHAFGECVDSACGIASCDVGWLDLDDDLTNGCEYRCIATETDDVICDLRDNDCDGAVDEDVDFDSDPSNCGSCGRLCRLAHATATCTLSTCELGACDADFWDIDGLATTGCEYACAQATPPTETCNALDDDCDGTVDEGDPGGGGSCGSSVGACTSGTEHCTGGTITCTGAVAPTTELCNGVDDDCDGTVDQGDPEGGSLCGTGVGACVQGRERCMGGSLVCVGAVGGTPELCNGLDDDCDGSIDEGDPEGGGSCGSGVGACVAGTEHCRGGVVVCEGDVGPITEVCNGTDDDCDGSTDEGNPGGGGSCGTDVGECTPGTRTCTGGSLVCVGATTGGPELCDALDNDCDGSIDEGNPGGGAPCGSSVGACTAGTETCTGGALVCTGGSGPTLETCNSIDDDCDGATDEDFMLLTDPTNCGSCGMVCSIPNAIAACTGGSCGLVACLTGFVDLDGLPANGCEYACSFNGAEVCNGLDDDCDGMTDEGLTAPSSFCNPNGVCAGTTATCAGAGGWVCTYPMATYEPSEATCDGLDNDCDGGVDEPFPLVGTSCNNGELGTCRRLGSYVCNMAGDGVACNAPAVGGGVPEVCNGLDDDCDGLLDDDAPNDWVQFSGSFGTRWIFAHEASRPDAGMAAAGSLSHRACSLPNRQPWTNVTYAEAQTACATVGGRLCTEAEWERACETGSSCGWSYASSCTTYQAMTCNGNGYDFDPGTPGDQDGLLPTGSLSSCYASWGGAGSRVFDMSGNVEEWAARRSAGINPIRGGSYNDTAGGIRCAFDFVVAGDTFQFPSVGFRCCRSTAPP